MRDIEFLHLIRKYEIDAVISMMEIKHGHVLEIGAGTGFQAELLTKAGYEVTAIDLEESNYFTNRIFPIQNYDGQHLPFPDAWFDVVFSSNVLEHIPHVYAFQKEIQRVLKPDGRAIHVVPSATWRLWTSLVHYPNLPKRIFSKIREIKTHDQTQLERKPMSKKPFFPKLQGF